MEHETRLPGVDVHSLLAAVVDGCEDAIIQQDLAGNVSAWNRGAQTMFGFAPPEILGRSLRMLVPRDHDGRLDAATIRARHSGRTQTLDLTLLTRDGQRAQLSVTVSPVRGADGTVLGTLLIGRDLTAQRRAEQALRRSEERWRAIIHSAVDAILLIDRRGVIELFNPAAERMFGYQAVEVLGKNVSLLMPEPYAAEHDHYLRRYQMTGERRIIGAGREVTALRKDSSTFPVHLSVGEVVVDGETKFTGIVRDLSERVSLEVRLREEAGLVRIGELAAVLAHEVKNPLAAVSGALQILREHTPGGEPQEILDEVLQRLDSLGGLMADLLVYARPPRPELRDVNAAELVHALVSFLKSDPAWTGLDVVVEGEQDKVRADPELLRVALQNLLLNGAQACGFRGRLTVRLMQDDSRAFVDVSDRGTGIPPEVRGKLFTPFFTTKARGTGLGLATVRRIAEAHAGGVEILSSGRDGTTMRLALPLAQRHAGKWSET